MNRTYELKLILHPREEGEDEHSCTQCAIYNPNTACQFFLLCDDGHFEAEIEPCGS